MTSAMLAASKPFKKMFGFLSFKSSKADPGHDLDTKTASSTLPHSSLSTSKAAFDPLDGKDEKKHDSNPEARREESSAMHHQEPAPDLADESSLLEMDPRQLMEAEKALYPGASSWARDEERLFEILFLREHMPLLPSHWERDFRGVPMSEIVFESSEKFPPIVYAHSSQEFHATTALTRLIDVTSNVRTASQSGLRWKASKLIKTSLDQYLDWAAKDSGFKDLCVVPNILVEVVDVTMGNDAVSEFMQIRMQAAAALQREFLRKDRHPDFWNTVKPELTGEPAASKTTLKLQARKLQQKRSAADAGLESQDFYAEDSFPAEGCSIDKGHSDEERPVKRHRSGEMTSQEVAELGQEDLFVSTASDSQSKLDDKGCDVLQKLKTEDSDVEQSTSPTTDGIAEHIDSHLRNWSRFSLPTTEVKIEESEAEKQELLSNEETLEFTRTPPVVYGLFVLNTSVFLLSIDSSKGDDAYVSFHVEMDFMDRQQSVWNALTVAIAVCLARDELRTRVEDFEKLPEEVESDPDA